MAATQQQATQVSDQIQHKPSLLHNNDAIYAHMYRAASKSNVNNCKNNQILIYFEPVNFMKLSNELKNMGVVITSSVSFEMIGTSEDTDGITISYSTYLIDWTNSNARFIVWLRQMGDLIKVRSKFRKNPNQSCTKVDRKFSDNTIAKVTKQTDLEDNLQKYNLG